jgi:hypothetical protein
LDLSQFGEDWIYSDENLWHIYQELDKIKHFSILTEEQKRNLRKQDDIEIGLDKIVEWKRRNRI